MVVHEGLDHHGDGRKKNGHEKSRGRKGIRPGLLVVVHQRLVHDRDGRPAQPQRLRVFLFVFEKNHFFCIVFFFAQPQRSACVLYFCNFVCAAGAGSARGRQGRRWGRKMFLRVPAPAKGGERQVSNWKECSHTSFSQWVLRVPAPAKGRGHRMKAR